MLWRKIKLTEREEVLGRDGRVDEKREVAFYIEWKGRPL